MTTLSATTLLRTRTLEGVGFALQNNRYSTWNTQGCAPLRNQLRRVEMPRLLLAQTGQATLFGSKNPEQ